MTKPKLIIAIDGYASTGKSSFAKAIARRLAYMYIDSGALYRATAYHALRKGQLRPNGEIDLEALAADFPLDIRFGMDARGRPFCLLDGENVERDIRSLEVSEHTSKLSKEAVVRAFVDSRLRALAVDKGVVMDGRDIGTAVFPQAELKIFMTALPEVRAQRRLKELGERGMPDTLENVLATLQQRDFRDSHREVNPLRQAQDAVVLDNSFLTMEDQMQWFEELLAQRWPQLLQ